ncbi:hypothetical protein BpHYR1_036949 [Brachionus plicatilis]|uniref:Uncharacterized protein n=1 Tax=Brachionus plicatilis TaxID=10195 RepID=A0A3M7S9N1_BRAPC|nr:hypothetical protein BpHYR1_036949 [Brachionus plicatilis]
MIINGVKSSGQEMLILKAHKLKIVNKSCFKTTVVFSKFSIVNLIILYKYRIPLFDIAASQPEIQLWLYRFRLGNNSGVDDQLDTVTSVSGRSRCSKRIMPRLESNFKTLFMGEMVFNACAKVVFQAVRLQYRTREYDN